MHQQKRSSLRWQDGNNEQLPGRYDLDRREPQEFDADNQQDGGWMPKQGNFDRNRGSQQGSNRQSQEMRQQGPHSGRGPKNWSRSDERIKDDISEQLMRHAEIDASEIEIEVTGAEITLKGTVSDKQAKRMAEDVAESVSGVKEVHNQIRLGARQEASDGDKRTKHTQDAANQAGSGSSRDHNKK